MDEKKQTVVVNIFGEDYPIRGTADPDYITHVASYLDGKMKEVADASPNKAPAKVAILAALNITDELFRSQNASSDVAANLEEETQNILDWLDNKLSESNAI